MLTEGAKWTFYETMMFQRLEKKPWLPSLIQGRAFSGHGEKAREADWHKFPLRVQYG